jgi:alpha-1,3-rhamnosyl/mannosyltransferase
VAVARLTIGFDAEALTSPAAGMRRYARELFGALARMTDEVRLVAVGADPAAPPPFACEIVRAPRLAPTNLGRMLVDLPLAVRGARLDLFHAPAYVAPLVGVHPLVVTIHDVSYARHPEWYPYRRDPLRRWFYRCSALAADRIITDSEFSRGEIVAAYRIPAERITVVPLAAQPAFTPGPVGERALPEGVTTPYVLHVGDLHARRNLELLVDAVCAVRTRTPALARLLLVLAGQDRGIGPGLAARAASQGHAGAVQIVGVVDDPILLALYRGAAALVYPSRYEGFGLPLVEAMACGTPVVAARAASIPEVVGEAGLLVEPEDMGGFAQALEAVLLDGDLGGQLREAGLRRAAEFTWNQTALRTIDVYRILRRVR